MPEIDPALLAQGWSTPEVTVRPVPLNPPAPVDGGPGQMANHEVHYHAQGEPCVPECTISTVLVAPCTDCVDPVDSTKTPCVECGEKHQGFHP